MVHATILEYVIFSQPDAYPPRGLVYTSHLPDLLITLLDVLLIYAYRIDPKHPRLVFQTQVSQGNIQIRRRAEGLTVDRNWLANLWLTPRIRESLVFWAFIQGDPSK